MAWLCSRHTGKDVRFPPTLQFLQLKVKLGKLDFLLGVPVQTAQQETSTTLPRPSLKQVACAMVLSADLPASQASVKFNISISAVHSGSCFDVGRIQSLQDSFEGASPKAIIHFFNNRQPATGAGKRHRQPVTGSGNRQPAPATGTCNRQPATANHNGFFEMAFGLFTLTLRFLCGWFRALFPECLAKGSRL